MTETRADVVAIEEAQFFDAGLVDVAVLIGWFTMVCMTLNSYDVPANATGLDQ